MLDAEPNSLTVRIVAMGLEPGQPHPQHVHGFPDNRRSVAPPPDLALTLEDGAPAGGLADGGLFPLASDGTINYTRTFTVDAALLEPLEFRVVELHGMTLPTGTAYDPTLPIAAAEPQLGDDGGNDDDGGGGGGGGNAIPLRAAVWPGIAMLTALPVGQRLRRWMRSP